MSEKQNVTLSIPKDLIRKAKIFAIDHETSLSGLMVELLTELVEQKDEYSTAKRKHLAILAKGSELGTGGSMSWTRESLHER